MCNNCLPSQIKTIGLTTTVFSSVLIFVCLFLVGFDFREAHHNWMAAGLWRHLAILQVTTVCAAFLVIVLGFIVFSCCSENKGIIGTYIGLNTLSMLFTMIISIFALIAGCVGNFNDYIGCNSKYQRILKYWKSIDHYFIEVDKTLGGTDCHMDMNDYAIGMFKMNPFASVIYDRWKIQDEPTEYEIVNYQNCAPEVRKKTDDEFIAKDKDSYGDGLIDYNLENFATFWGHIENRFDCVGWCTTVYQGKQDNDAGQMVLYKYLFSDINKGPVKYKGCLKQLLMWLPRVMLAYGSLTLIASVLQVAGFILALALMMKGNKDIINDDKPVNIQGVINPS